MSFMRGVGRWLLAIIVSLALSAWLLCATLQLTVLNRQVVKGWAQNSGIYSKGIDSIPFQIGEEQTGQSLITGNDIKAALKTTLPASYLQTEGEKIFDASYDWLEGKTDRITFSIALADKKEAFATNLATQLQPKLDKLPVCTSRVAPSTSNPTCLPKGVTAAQFASQLSNITKDDGQGFLDQPITQDMFKDANPAFAKYLPLAVAQVSWLIIALPIAVVVCATGYVLLSNSKLRGMMIISRRTFIQAVIACALGGVLWYFGQNVQLTNLLPSAEDASAAEMQTAVIQNIIEPVLRNILPSFGQAMTLLGGGVAIVCAIVWLLAIVLRKRQIGQKEHFDHVEHTPNPLLRVNPEDKTSTPEPEKRDIKKESNPNDTSTNKPSTPTKPPTPLVG